MVGFTRKRGWTLFGRMSQSSNPEPDKSEDYRPAEQIESTALPHEEPVPSASSPEPVPLKGDPIQSLFSSLGKFNRYLSQAQHAPDSTTWVENCMNELATSLEIAIICGWDPVKETIIDAARVLHSYEIVGRHKECIPFLNTSYEILSLMVGDLIVDKVRPGVIQKWKDLFSKTVEDMTRAGITLVVDEEEEEPPRQVNRATDPTIEPGYDRKESVGQEDVSSLSAASQSEGLTNIPAVESKSKAEALPEVITQIPPLSEPDEEECIPPPETYSDSILAFPKIPTERKEVANDGGTREEIDGNERQESITVEKESPCIIEPIDAYRKEKSSETSTSKKIYQEDELFTQEYEEEVLQEEVEREPGDQGEFSCSEDTIEEEVTPEESVAIVQPESALCDSDLLDTVPITAANEPLSTDESSPADSCPVAELPKGQKTSPVPEQWLKQAQEAVKSGNVASAKSAALELALAMARIEYEQALANVAEAEQQLEDNTQAVKVAQEKVDAAEISILQTEELLAMRNGENLACRDRISAIGSELDQLQAELKQIEEELEALQRRRAEQLNRIENKRHEQQEAVHIESRLQTEIESLYTEVETARDTLETLQEQKKQKIAEKHAIQAEICRLQEEAERRNLALKAIEETLMAQRVHDSSDRVMAK